jgi:uncharacterized protein (DUF697 family)
MGWLDSLNAAAKGRGKSLDDSERERIAADIVTMSSMGAAVVTLAPIPLSDFVVVTPVQASMVMAVGRIYGRELNLSESKHILVELGSVCGVGLLAQKGFATLSKLLLPGLGGVLAGPYAFAVTYGMGRVAMSYFRGKDATRDTLKRVYEDAVAEGKKIFSKEKLDEFRKKRGAEVEDFARGDGAGSNEAEDSTKDGEDPGEGEPVTAKRAKAAPAKQKPRPKRTKKDASKAGSKAAPK